MGGLVGVMLVPLGWSVLRSLLRGDVGVDAIALISIAGALALRVFCRRHDRVDVAGGNALEEVAGKRARRELTKLVERAPRIAHRRRGDTVEEVPVEEVAVGDRSSSGRVRSCRRTARVGKTRSGRVRADGEPLPAAYGRGESIRSGTANAGDDSSPGRATCRRQRLRSARQARA